MASPLRSGVRPAVLVAGAGIMGGGIAQVAAQAGHDVWLHDTRPGAAAAARHRIGDGLAALVGKGRLTADVAEATLARIHPVDGLADTPTSDLGLVVEAIVEDLAAKRALLVELAGRLGEHVILASNTSSISVTALAAGLPNPGRVVGMHFFNPVPQMRLVEVVHGLQSDAAVAQRVAELAADWGKVPVHARSTPGFIVNRIARPYYAEALALLQAQATTPAVIDACLCAAGFRMGPCELMDLIGHDTNLAVTRSVFDANFGDRRYGPSLLQAEMVAGGLLGRKSGQGFYRYPEGRPAPATSEPRGPDLNATIQVHGSGPRAEALRAACERVLGRPVGHGTATERVGLSLGTTRLEMTTGPTATARAAALGHPDVVLFDRFEPGKPPGGPLALAAARTCSPTARDSAERWLAALGYAPQWVADTPGLIVARTLAMLINEAADAVTQGICTPEAADAAMKLGVNYPRGPFEWLHDWGAPAVAAVIDALDDACRGERYRLNPDLRAQALAQGLVQASASLRPAPPD